MVVKQVSAMKSAPVNKELPLWNGGEGVGAYIRRLLVLGASSEAILERVHAQFPGSKATKADVAYNKHKLKKDSNVPVIVESRAPKYIPAAPAEKSPFTALRTKIDKSVSDATLAAMLHHTVDYLEKLK